MCYSPQFLYLNYFYIRVYRNYSNYIILGGGGGAKVNWDFRISGLVKIPDGTVANFGEVRRAQLAKSTILASTLGHL